MTTRAQATGDAIENTIAKAEIAIEKVLRDLEREGIFVPDPMGE